jgi:hypothetical protein
MRILATLVLGAGLALSAPSLAEESATQATLYKSPQCGCCESYADYLRANGYEVEVVATHDLPLVKQQHGVPTALEGCHTTLVDGYVVEGHVPVTTLDRLLAERPAIKGISLPGMPTGSPGMSGPKTEPFTIYELSDEAKVYAVE